jgi:hypothetical protein
MIGKILTDHCENVEVTKVEKNTEQTCLTFSGKIFHYSGSHGSSSESINETEIKCQISEKQMPMSEFDKPEKPINKGK